jgi:hypothetical protein
MAMAKSTDLLSCIPGYIKKSMTDIIEQLPTLMHNLPVANGQDGK